MVHPYFERLMSAIPLFSKEVISDRQVRNVVNLAEMRQALAPQRPNEDVDISPKVALAETDLSQEKTLPLEGLSVDVQKAVEDVMMALVEQSANPPGKDRCIGDFYIAVLDLVSEGTSAVADLIVKVQQERPMPASLHVSLLFRVFQAEIYLDETYPDRFSTPNRSENIARWKEQIVSLLKNNTSRENIQRNLKEKSTVTNQSARYVGPRIILNLLQSKKPADTLHYMDLGCSSNQGAMRVASGDFEPQDLTTSKVVDRNAHRAPNIKGLGVDIEDITDRGFIEWLNACSFYPKELADAKASKKLITNLTTTSDRVGFVQSDIVNLPIGQGEFTESSQDVVSIQTVLYQMPREIRRKVIENAQKLIKPEGFVVIQDFVRPDETQDFGFSMSDDWGSDGCYRMMVLGKKSTRALEVFMYDGGRCKTVREGADYEEFMSLLAGDTAQVVTAKRISSLNRVVRRTTGTEEVLSL